MQRTQSLPSDVTSDLTGLEWLNTVTLSLATLEVDDASSPSPLARNRPSGGSFNKKTSSSSGNSAVPTYRRRSVSVSGSISDSKRSGGRSRSKSTTSSGATESGYTSAYSDPDSPGSSDTDDIDDLLKKTASERVVIWKNIKQCSSQPPYTLDYIIALAMCTMKPKHHSGEKLTDYLRSQVPFFAAKTKHQLGDAILTALQSNKHFVQSRTNRAQWTCVPSRVTALVCPKQEGNKARAVESTGGHGRGLSRSNSVPTAHLSSSLPTSALPWAAMTVRGSDTGAGGAPLRRRLSGKKKSDSGATATTAAPIAAPKRRRSLGSASKSTTYKAKTTATAGTTGGTAGTTTAAGRFRSQSLTSHTSPPSVADVLNDAPDLTGMAAWQHLDAHAHAHALVDPGDTLLRGGFDTHAAVPVAGHVFPTTPPPQLLHQHQMHQMHQMPHKGGTNAEHAHQLSGAYPPATAPATFAHPPTTHAIQHIGDEVFEGFDALDSDAFMFEDAGHHPDPTFPSSFDASSATGTPHAPAHSADDLWATATDMTYGGFGTDTPGFPSELDLHLGDESIPDTLLSGRTSSDNDESWLPTTYIGGSGGTDDLLTAF
eukprot:m.1115066 g.1115066  ORF g.1115066 m.1115066 type:complete len:598 (+) comp24369_c0_seq7:290-2083(+)